MPSIPTRSTSRKRRMQQCRCRGAVTKVHTEHTRTVCKTLAACRHMALRPAALGCWRVLPPTGAGGLDARSDDACPAHHQLQQLSCGAKLAGLEEGSQCGILHGGRMCRRRGS